MIKKIIFIFMFSLFSNGLLADTLISDINNLSNNNNQQESTLDPQRINTIYNSNFKPRTNLKLEPALYYSGCCKICSRGKACGNSCISRSYTCHQPPGCACDG